MGTQTKFQILKINFRVGPVLVQGGPDLVQGGPLLVQGGPLLVHSRVSSTVKNGFFTPTEKIETVYEIMKSVFDTHPPLICVIISDVKMKVDFAMFCRFLKGSS